MKQDVDALIVGLGIGGICLAYELYQRGKTFVVIDPCMPNATFVAAGNINPVTGRHYTKSWMIDRLMAQAKSTYKGLSEILKAETFLEQTIYRTLSSVKEENAWMSRLQEDEYLNYISGPIVLQDIVHIIPNASCVGPVQGAMRVLTAQLITAAQSWLRNSDSLMRERFNYGDFQAGERISYKDISAGYIYFAEGAGMVANPLFKDIAIEPTKGEVLIVSISEELEYNVKDKLFVTPLSKERCWVGSGYEWSFEDEGPTERGFAKLKDQLESFLKCPYQVEGHLAGIRPCVKDRKPIVGRHRQYKNVLLFNGLGTKGTSLAPYFANHLVSHIYDNMPIMSEVDVSRFG